MSIIAVKTTVNLNPWQVPNFATVVQEPGKRDDGVKPLPTIPVAALDAEALEALAAMWLSDLYAKAGRICPFSAIHGK